MKLPVDPGTYLIRDRESDRFYIGSAANLRERWAHHLYRLRRGDHPNPILQAIWNVDQARLVIEVIDVVDDAASETRLKMEQALLDAAGVGSNSACMNVLAVAGSHQGRKRSAETRARMALAQRGRPSPSAETRARMREAKLGKALSAAHRARIGAAHKGKPDPPRSPEQAAVHRKYQTSTVTRLRELVGSGWAVSHACMEIGMSITTAHRILKGRSYKGVGLLDLAWIRTPL